MWPTPSTAGCSSFTFGSADDAEQYLEELLPGWRSIQANTSKFGYPGEWIDLFQNERVIQHSTDTESEREAPNSLLSSGRFPGQEVFVESLHRHGIALKDLRAESMSDYNRGVQATVLSVDPGKTLLAMEATASVLNVSLHLSIDAPKPLEMTFRRLWEQLKHRTT